MDALVHLDRAMRPLARHRAAGRTEARTTKIAGPLDELIAWRYQDALAELGWHGRTSHMRMVWQDADVQAALLDADHAAALAADAVGDRPSRLAALLLAGLAELRPSYLLTAAPNWRSRPMLVHSAWARLDDMAAPPDPRPPLLVNERGLERGLTAMRRFGAALSPPSAGPSESTLDRATVGALVNTVESLLDESRAALLVRGSAGASTELDRMSGQCLEVMTGLPALLEAHHGDHAAVLGYGIVSHALDAKHLVAVIVSALKLRRYEYRQVTGPDAVRTLADLLAGAADGRIGAHASDLIRARLRQSVALMAHRHRELGVELDHILASLTEPAEFIRTIGG
ncbi:hypothetical protein ACFRAO_37365 [Streptomyces sp. NPDC056656]|uniref:hypothetical protein n=1 Tax=Streptomyces sp. NPDC056656 TaxID=3345895 RepID=UPI0036BE0781